jgi:hypothetical protein
MDALPTYLVGFKVVFNAEFSLLAACRKPFKNQQHDFGQAHSRWKSRSS